MHIQNNLINTSFNAGVKNSVFLSSSCIYPKLDPYPLKEKYLLTGLILPTKDRYAIAKISGVKACNAIRKPCGLNYVNFTPVNLYGPIDNFDLNTDHRFYLRILCWEICNCDGRIWSSVYANRKAVALVNCRAAMQVPLRQVGVAKWGRSNHPCPHLYGRAYAIAYDGEQPTAQVTSMAPIKARWRIF